MGKAPEKTPSLTFFSLFFVIKRKKRELTNAKTGTLRLVCFFVLRGRRRFAVLVVAIGGRARPTPVEPERSGELALFTLLAGRSEEERSAPALVSVPCTDDDLTTTNHR